MLCSSPTASLPSPYQVWQESFDLIAYPFFNYGSQDIGLGWRVLISLQRVAYGFGLAAVAGVIVGAVIGYWWRCAALIRSSVLRTVSATCSAAALARRLPERQPPAIFVIFITSIWPVIINTAVGVRNIPQDYRNVAQVLRLNQIEFFFKIAPLGGSLPHRPSHGVGLSPGWRSSRLKCSPAVGIGFFI